MRLKSLCFALLLTLPVAAAAQTTEDILAKVYAARGGLEKIRAIRAQRVSGRISFGEDADGPFVVELKRPLKMHMELTVQDRTMVRVYDGKSHGWANNPFADKPDPEAMNEGELQNISEESDFDGPLVDYKSKGNEVELVGKDKEKVDGKEVWRLKLTTPSGEVRYYLFDSESFLLLKWEGKRKFNGQEFPVESYFHDYRDVDGVKFAFEIDSGTSASDIKQRIAIDKIELNPKLEESRFAQPPAAAPPATPATPASSAPPDSR
jgi:outer membrane lipoprotein-sorting protein